MADAGFFKGTSADQDRRFSDKELKLLKSIKFPPEFDKKVDMRKVELRVIRPWIAKKVVELVGFEDEVVVEYAMGLLEDEAQPTPDPKKMQINLTGFLTASTPVFMSSLWLLLLDAQESPAGVPKVLVEEKKEEMRAARRGDGRVFEERDRRRLDEIAGDGRGRGRGRGRGGRGRGGWDERDGGRGRGRDAGWGGRGGGPPPHRRSPSYSRSRSPPPRRRSFTPPPRRRFRDPSPPIRDGRYRDSPPPRGGRSRDSRTPPPPPRRRGSRTPPPSRRRSSPRLPRRRDSRTPPPPRRRRSPSLSSPRRRISRSPPPRRRRPSFTPSLSRSRSRSPGRGYRRRSFSPSPAKRRQSPLGRRKNSSPPRRRRRSPSSPSPPPRGGKRARRYTRSRSPTRSRSWSSQRSSNGMDVDVNEGASERGGGELRIKGQAEVEKRKGKSRWEDENEANGSSGTREDLEKKENELKERALRNKVVRTRKGS